MNQWNQKNKISQYPLSITVCFSYLQGLRFWPVLCCHHNPVISNAMRIHEDIHRCNDVQRRARTCQRRAARCFLRAMSLAIPSCETFLAHARVIPRTRCEKLKVDCHYDCHWDLIVGHCHTKLHWHHPTRSMPKKREKNNHGVNCCHFGAQHFHLSCWKVKDGYAHASRVWDPVWICLIHWHKCLQAQNHKRTLQRNCFEFDMVISHYSVAFNHHIVPFNGRIVGYHHWLGCNPLQMIPPCSCTHRCEGAPDLR